MKSRIDVSEPVARLHDIKVGNDQVSATMEILSKEFAKSVDASLFFPVWDYERRQMTIKQKVREKIHTWQDRIERAWQILKGEHVCCDCDY